MSVAIIAAVGSNGVIGNEAGLPWRLPRDLKRFRELTWGKPIIMGRKTFALLGKPLPGRLNIVLTHQREYVSPGCRVVHSVEEALTAARDELRSTTSEANEIMVIGGAEIYRQFMPICERGYWTVVHGRFEGNVTFPEEFLHQPAWELARQEHWPHDEKNSHRHSFYVVERLTQPSASARTLASLLETAEES
jgi:dihydrofolate reductase